MSALSIRAKVIAVIAFMLMPLAGAIAINFSAPLWSAALSIVWLKERADFARWAALLATPCKRDCASASRLAERELADGLPWIPTIFIRVLRAQPA